MVPEPPKGERVSPAEMKQMVNRRRRIFVCERFSSIARSNPGVRGVCGIYGILPGKPEALRAEIPYPKEGSLKRAGHAGKALVFFA